MFLELQRNVRDPLLSSHTVISTDLPEIIPKSLNFVKPQVFPSPTKSMKSQCSLNRTISKPLPDLYLSDEYLLQLNK